MPSQNSLEFNEENLAKVLTELYREVESDQTLHNRLLSEPFAVLSERINMPDEYQGGIFAREKNKKTLMLYVPTFNAARSAMPEGTSTLESSPDYEVLCTFPTIW